MKNRHLNFVTTLAALIALCFTATSAAGPETTGQWVQGGAMPINWSVHSAILPTGKAIMWPGDEGATGNDTQSWDPATGNFSLLAKPGYNLFCAGHTFLADGRLFVAGGHDGQNNFGLKEAIIYNSLTDSWTVNLPDMNAGRWYPTITILPNGDPLVVSGSVDLTIGPNPLPQVFQMATGTWRNLTNAELQQDLYPFMLLAPNGKVFSPGPTPVTRYLDTAGTGSWSFVANRPSYENQPNGVFRDYGSAVMYEPGKVLVMGGGSPSTKTAEVIDLNQPTPSWRAVAPMQFSRRMLNAVLLPDGKVLVTGGYTETGTAFNQLCTSQIPDPCVYAAELWDPATETWSTLASGSIPRVYHSMTNLLPDGRVMYTGGNHQPVIEIFSPPYLFQPGTRPTITSAPTSFNYGQSIFVETPDALTIDKVRILRYSSTTHSFNHSQYLNSLSFSQTAGGINVIAPPNANVGPPGPYMLFIVNGNGVPSVSKLIQLGVASSPPTLPDVIVTSVSYANGIFTSTVKNQGTAATPAGTVIGVGYSVDGVWRASGSVGGPLAAGATVTIGTDGSPYTIPTGTHTINANVDDINRFAESDETNNQLTQSIIIG
ncbi:MAG: DUF1929 domain-containing protein, partial [Methylococcales bacterium]|nr:DUF1929 domain-containing protein [Methylococcales bacterium]